MSGTYYCPYLFLSCLLAYTGLRIMIIKSSAERPKIRKRCLAGQGKTTCTYSADIALVKATNRQIQSEIYSRLNRLKNI